MPNCASTEDGLGKAVLAAAGLLLLPLVLLPACTQAMARSSARQ
jgi:hypothetical protein